MQWAFSPTIFSYLQNVCLHGPESTYKCAHFPIKFVFRNHYFSVRSAVHCLQAPFCIYFYICYKWDPWSGSLCVSLNLYCGLISSNHNLLSSELGNNNNVLAFMWTNVTLNFEQLQNVINVCLIMQFVMQNFTRVQVVYKKEFINCNAYKSLIKEHFIKLQDGRNWTIQRRLELHPDNWTQSPSVQPYPAL